MNFKEGEVLYFDKPLRWTSFAVVNKIRYHISRKLGVKKIAAEHLCLAATEKGLGTCWVCNYDTAKMPRNLHAPLCGIFCPNSVVVARYDALIRTKSPTNCDAHLA